MRRRHAVPPLCVLALALASIGLSAPGAVLPAASTGPRESNAAAGLAAARAFIAALSAGTDDAFIAFEKEWRSPAAAQKRPLEERVAGFKRIAADIGTLTVDVLEGDARSGHIAGRGSAKGLFFDFQLIMSGDPPKLDGIRIQASSEPPPPGGVAKLSAEERDTALATLATLLEQRYVFPAMGAKLAALVRDGARNGRWADADDAFSLSARLTEDLRAAGHDGHLSVRPAAEDDNGPKGSVPGAVPGDHGFIETKILGGNVGYVRLDMFDDGPDALAVAAREMKKVEGARALIFDLRKNGGGSPEMIEFLAGYLFEKPTLLNRFVGRDGTVDSTVTSRASVPGKRFAPDVPVFVLTSKSTYSAAEEFAYDLKMQSRATIVGETTGGGAHPVNGFKIHPHLKAQIPIAHAVNPVSNTDWEGAGVAPDVPVAADRALDEALKALAPRGGRH